MKTENATYLYVTAFVDELVRAGLHNVVICPGSRSTPLSMIFAQQQAVNVDIRIWMHADERSAAFFALGMAKASVQPVGVVCTSGTAAANFLPAVVEAHYSRIPLVVLTADRPPELRDIGAPQTIDQIRLFGTHAKWFAEMALPEGTQDLLRYARVMANRSVAEAITVPAGPVHLNFPFREPLVPTPIEEILPPRSDEQPFTQVETGTRHLDSETVERLSDELRRHSHGLIICGPSYQHDPVFPVAVVALADALNYPILADPLSGVRYGDHDVIIDAYDAFLRDAHFAERVAPDVIIRFGAAVTSKPLTQYLQRYPDIPQYIVDEGGAWNDPSLRASHLLRVQDSWLCEALARQSKIGKAETSDSVEGAAWRELWCETNRCTRAVITETINSFTETFEGRVYAELSALIPEDGILFASSSMPVRDLDTFFPAQARPIRFLANRGANGIDGVVSSALGASTTTDVRTVLVIGDLAFFHDLNGLLAAKLHEIRATIVIVNNDGGGIFSFLPQAAHPEHFEQLFGTPHGLDFRYAAALYGATYSLAEHWESFRDTIKRSLSGGLSIIEVRTNRQTNVTLHRQVWAAVSAALPTVLEHIT